MITDEIDSFTGKYKFLSNFYLCSIFYQGILYPSTEHAYQAAKSRNVHDRIKVSYARSPALAKKMGYSLPLRLDWEYVKNDIMREILWIKFTTNLDLQNRLLETGEAFLIEGNTWGDTYWGVCNDEGLNYLGNILMHIRHDLNVTIL